jgi:hypothetical protein
LIDQLLIPTLPASWDGAGTRPSNLGHRPAATVIAAHGAWYTGNGLVRVPAGDRITTYVPIGTSMGNDLGLDIDTGNVHGADGKYLHVYTVGQLIPNFTFAHYDDDVTGAHVINPSSPTTLNTLLKPNQGQVSIATCEDLFVPKGESLDQALSKLPLYTPGRSDPVGSTRAGITAQGQLSP